MPKRFRNIGLTLIKAMALGVLVYSAVIILVYRRNGTTAEDHYNKMMRDFEGKMESIGGVKDSTGRWSFPANNTTNYIPK